MTDLPSLLNTSPPASRNELASMGFHHPDDVLADTYLTTHEKRTLLASWVSDANAVPHVPFLRQLPNGSVVKAEDILHALKALDDGGNGATDVSHDPLWRRSFKRRRGWTVRHWIRRGREPDDDDPPPCPAYSIIPPRSGGGAAHAYPESVFA